MRALGYARVSLPEEHIENQVREIEEFARREGYELLKIFRDEGVSGGRPAFERPGFSQMIEAAKLLDVKVLIFYDLTRLGRDLFDVVNTYRKLLEDGFTVLFVKHPELNAKPDSYVAEALRKAMLALLGIAAEMERAFIRERTRAALERLKSEGKRVGRPPYPFPEEKVRQLLRQGKTIADTWRALRDRGDICREVKGEKKCMSYETFRRKVRLLRARVLGAHTP